MAINHIIVSGNAGKDFEVRQTGNGKTIGQFSIAATQGYGDYKKTSWLTVRVLSEGFCKFLEGAVKKGTPVVVSGEFVLETWEKDGVQKSMATIIAREVVVNTPKSGDAGSSSGQVIGHSNGGSSQHSQPQQNKGGGQNMDFDDDIPF
ncbi:single-stranded DNA-binding protein [Gibbsiella quercinecans]|uniref:single-stranded DNA-binding protein n=1 Tax=Gibbsiella quercinecans TaxID=929813 RepID=UPI00242B1707|nr:single-stranded DNA-binding protein [Gibbsiella quercinecans]